MFEILFGAEMPLPVRFFIAVPHRAGIDRRVTAWVVRRFGARAARCRDRARPPAAARRDRCRPGRRPPPPDPDPARQCRAPLMIGGPTDVVVEANIVRAAAVSPRATPPRRGRRPRPRRCRGPCRSAMPACGRCSRSPRRCRRRSARRLPRSRCNGRWNPTAAATGAAAPDAHSRSACRPGGRAVASARTRRASRCRPICGGPGVFVPREPARPREPCASAKPRPSASPSGTASPRMRDPELAREREAVRAGNRCEREPARAEPSGSVSRSEPNRSGSASPRGCASRSLRPGRRAGIQRQCRPEPGRDGAAAGSGPAPPRQAPTTRRSAETPGAWAARSRTRTPHHPCRRAPPPRRRPSRSVAPRASRSRRNRLRQPRKGDGEFVGPSERKILTASTIARCVRLRRWRSGRS